MSNITPKEVMRATPTGAIMLGAHGPQREGALMGGDLGVASDQATARRVVVLALVVAQAAGWAYLVLSESWWRTKWRARASLPGDLRELRRTIGWPPAKHR